jgi:hypothetical protein
MQVADMIIPKETEFAAQVRHAAFTMLPHAAASTNQLSFPHLFRLLTNSFDALRVEALVRAQDSAVAFPQRGIKGTSSSPRYRGVYSASKSTADMMAMLKIEGWTSPSTALLEAAPKGVRCMDMVLSEGIHAW